MNPVLRGFRQLGRIAFLSQLSADNTAVNLQTHPSQLGLYPQFGQGSRQPGPYDAGNSRLPFGLFAQQISLPKHESELYI